MAAHNVVPVDNDGLFRFVARPRGMGLGAVASAIIPAGTVICVDFPLLVLRGDEIGARDIAERTPSEHKLYHMRGPAVLLAKYKELPEADQRRVAELHDCHEEAGDPKVRKMLLTIKQRSLGISESDATKLYSSGKGAVPGLEGTKSVFGIFGTNAIPQDLENALGLYPLISRFNHSCIPNAVYQWRDALRTNVVTATREIAEGEEICVSYFKSLYMTHNERAKRTMMAWGFQCQCQACESVSDEMKEEFEAATARIRQLAKGDPTLVDDDIQHLISPEHQEWMIQRMDSDGRRERLWKLNQIMERAAGLQVGLRMLAEMQQLFTEEKLLPGLTIEKQLVYDKVNLYVVYGSGAALEKSREVTRELCRLEELLHGKEGNKELEKYTRWRDSRRGAPTPEDFMTEMPNTLKGMPADGCPTQ